MTLLLFLHVVEHKPIWYHRYTCTVCGCVRLCFYVWLGFAYGVCVDYLLYLAHLNVTFEWEMDFHLLPRCVVSVCGRYKAVFSAVLLSWRGCLLLFPPQCSICSSELTGCLPLHCIVGIVCCLLLVLCTTLSAFIL